MRSADVQQPFVIGKHENSLLSSEQVCRLIDHESQHVVERARVRERATEIGQLSQPCCVHRTGGDVRHAHNNREKLRELICPTTSEYVDAVTPDLHGMRRRIMIAVARLYHTYRAIGENGIRTFQQKNVI